MSTNATVEEKAVTPARRAFHLRSIRTRLLVIFVLLVLLPAAIIGIVTAVGSLRFGQQQAINQLESVATLKQGEIDNWVQSLQLDLSVEPAGEQVAQRLVTLLRTAPDTTDYQAAYMGLVNRFQQTIELRKNFEELFVMDLKGRVVLSTDAVQEGKAYDKQDFFAQGLKGSYVHPPVYSTSLGRMSVIAVQPVKDGQGQVVGVLAGRANITRLSQIMTQRTGLGQTGETYLVGSNAALLTEVRSAENVGYVHTQGTADAIENRGNGFGTYQNYGGVAVLGVYHWLPELQVALVAEQAQSEAFAATYATLGMVVGIALVAVLAAAAIGFVVTRGIANPLANLAETSAKIAGGDLAARAQAIASGDEIGVLATSFNAMADRVGTLLTGLGERSRELEASQRVAVAASERVSPDDLLDLVVNLVRDQFDLYHVQVYVVDEAQAAAVLRQSTGFAGRQLLQKGHKIPLDRPALVTQAIREGQPVLVDDVTRTAGFLPNPLLPDTKSELVVPLKVGDKVIGALDAQDRTPGRFGQSTVALFETMANQISFLFENSQLLERTTAQTEALNLFTNQLRTAADIARRLGAILDPERLLQQVVELMQSRFGLYHAHIYVLDEATDRLVIRAGSGEVGRVLRERGHSIALDAEKSLVARAARGRETVLVNDTSLESDFMPNPLLPQTRSEVALPLVVGDKVLGVLDVQDDQAGRFNQADLDTFATLAGQVATSLQNARLFETQKQAEEAVRESQQRFQGLVETLSDWIWEVDAKGAYTYVSPKVADLLGYAPEELLGKTPFDLMPPEEVERVAAIFGPLASAQQPIVALENANVHKDGHLVVFETSGLPFYDAAGQFLGYRGTDRDITERKRAEEAIRKLGRQDEEALRVARMGHWEFDVATQIFIFNDQYYTLHGTTAAQAGGYQMTAEEFARKYVHPDDAQIVGYSIGQALETTDPNFEFQIEARILRADGEARWVTVWFRVEKDAQGRTVRLYGVNQDITERKRAEAALQASVARFEGFAEATQYGFGMAELDGTIVYGNTALSRMVGEESPAMMAGKPIPAYYPPELLERITGEILPTIMEKGAWRGEMEFLTRDGRRVPIEENYFVIRDAEGAPRYIADIMTDITERKQAAAALEEQRRFLRQVIDIIPHWIFVKNREGRFTLANVAQAEAFGMTVEELLGKDDYDLNPNREEAEQFIRDDRQVMDTLQEKFVPEEVTRDARGREYWLQTIKCPIIDENGTANQILGVATDITLRKRAEQAVRESEERFHRFSDVTVEGLVFHEQGKILDVNEALTAMFGYSEASELVGRGLLEFIAPESRETVLKQTQSGSTQPYEALAVRKDGTVFPVEATAGVYEFQGRTIRVASIHDITERKQAQEAVRQSQQMLQLVMNNIPQSIFWKDRNLTYLGCNNNFAQDTGKASPEEVIGKTDYDMPWLDQAELYRADDKRVMDADQPVLGYEEPQTTPDGSQIWLRTSKVPLHDAEGQVMAVLGMYEDVTDRKRAEAERERFTAQLSTAADVAGQMSAILDPDQLLSAVITLLHDRFNLYHAHFYGLDAAAGELVLRAGYGEPGRIMLERGHKIPLEREQSLVARAARTKEPVLVNDVTQAPDFLPNPLLPETRSEVAVPAIAGGQMLGVFDVQQNIPNYFTQADLDVFTTLTGQIATALQNAGYVEMVEARLQVSQALAGAQTEDEVLDAMIKVVGFYPQAQVSIYTFDPQASEPTAVARRIDTFDSGQAVIVQPGMAFPASMFPVLGFIAADRAFVSANMATDERVDPASRELVRLTGGVSMAALPITAGNEWLGLIAATSVQEGYFDVRKLYLYQSLAEQGAIALRTARLHDQVQESLAETRVRFKVSQALAGAQTEEEVLDVLIQQMGVYPNAQVGIDLIDPSAAELTYVVRRNATFDSGLEGHEPGMRFSATQFRLAERFSPDTLFVSPNTQLDDRFDPLSREFARRAGHTSIAILPITAGTEWLGVIGAFSSEEGYFDEDKLHLYRTVAEQGAVALHTARLYDETQRTAERLKEVDRLKSEFLANMSHELRTPLNSILGYTEVMLMGIDGEMDPETQADVQAIYDNGQHLLHLISDILDLAKIEAGRLNLNFETVDVRPLIEEIVTSTNGLLLKRQKPVEFIVQVAEDLPAAQVDRLRLNQILNNLLSNAVKFTEEGHITLRAVGDGDHICFEVEDTGIGISPTDQERIFEQFRQADGSYRRRAEGTGLGLAITRYLVQMHGGTVVVHSQPGQGSTFTVRLPLKRQTAEQAIEAAIPAAGKGRKGRGNGKGK
jgi:PAS domain S-box-containing protein